MPLEPYKQPPAGAKIGATADLNALPEHKRAAIGDFEAELQKRGLTPEEAAAPTTVDLPPPTVGPPPLDPDETQRIERGVQTLEALNRVMEQEEPEEPEELPVDPVEKDAEPTAEEKQEFIRCVLGNRQYRKKYELFGGAYVVEFADLTPGEEENLYRALKDMPEGDDWAVTLGRMRMVASTVSTTFSDLLQSDPVITPAAVNETVNLLKSQTHYRTLMYTYRVFRRHLEIMLERALDSDFWRADGFSSPPEPLPEEPSTTDESPDTAAGNSSNISSST